jgi:hypothetical protein
MSGHRSLFLVTLVCFALLAQLGPTRADKRIALTVGNANYKDTPALTNPGNDATDDGRTVETIDDARKIIQSLPVKDQDSHSWQYVCELIAKAITATRTECRTASCVERARSPMNEPVSTKSI